MQLQQGDCLSVMQNIPDKSVDMILCDLPYGTTHCIWDTVIPFAPLWEQYRRVCKANAAIVLFGAQPFTTDLINSNRKMFRYEWIWEKTLPLGFLNAKKMPLRVHENILVFYSKLPTYNPQKWHLTEAETKERQVSIGRRRFNGTHTKQYNQFEKSDWSYVDTGERYPRDIIKISNWNGALFGDTRKVVKHPTQKPVELLEYLIKTYTNKGDTVLDNCMGSGSTGVACVNTERDFIGIELDKNYFEIAQSRIKNSMLSKRQ